MKDPNRSKQNLTKPESAVAYVCVAQNDQKSLQEQVTSCRAFCAGRGMQVTRVFTGIGDSIDAHNPDLALRKALDFCNVKKNGISMMVIPDLGSITGNADAHSRLSAIHYDLQRNGIKLQRVDYNPNEEWFEGFLEVAERFDRNQ